jgi:hypothetical protein
MTDQPVPTSVHHITWPPVKLVEHPAFRARVGATGAAAAPHRVPAAWPTAPIRASVATHPSSSSIAGCL